MGLASLWQRPQRAPSPLPPCENMAENAIYESGSKSLPDTKSAGTLILDFQPPNCKRWTCAVYKPPSVECLLWQPTLSKTAVSPHLSRVASELLRYLTIDYHFFCSGHSLFTDFLAPFHIPGQSHQEGKKAQLFHSPDRGREQENEIWDPNDSFPLFWSRTSWICLVIRSICDYCQDSCLPTPQK